MEEGGERGGEASVVSDLVSNHFRVYMPPFASFCHDPIIISLHVLSVGATRSGHTLLHHGVHSSHCVSHICCVTLCLAHCKADMLSTTVVESSLNDV